MIFASTFIFCECILSSAKEYTNVNSIEYMTTRTPNT